MNDRFKFRVWADGAMYMSDTDSNTPFALNQHGALIKSNDGQSYYWARIAHNECVVEQCTGMKDKNGKLIYEGDLLETGGRRYVVCWAHHGFVMRFTPDSASSYPLGGTDLFEIIGNIHEQKDVE